ncbi:MAG: hypothetical protein HC881_14150 [Leptolyngbyaceae cyanobacterium SL_7_1]|nr:hypothetical protein [Leptolyngbyaceae cyanobacterium SL_7_1]
MAVSILKDGKPIVLSVEDMIQFLDADAELTKAQAIRTSRRLNKRKHSPDHSCDSIDPEPA